MSQVAKASLLLFFLSLCAAATLVTHHVRDHRPPPTPRELFGVVNEQLIALRTADFSSAYRYAATGVQQKLTLPQFETMARNNYGEMTHARRVEFGSAKVQGSTAVVQVFFFDADGNVRAFLYSLTFEGDTWKIGGIEELRGYRPSRTLAGTHA